MYVLFQFPLQLMKERGRTHTNKLEKILQELLESHGEGWTEELRADLPRSFQRHGDLVLLGENCFTLPLWKKCGTLLKFFELTLKHFFCWRHTVGWSFVGYWCVTLSGLQHLWDAVAKGLGAKRLAIMSRISCDGFRSPRVTMLLGEHSWAKHVDNGIRYFRNKFLLNLSLVKVSPKHRSTTFQKVGS